MSDVFLHYLSRPWFIQWPWFIQSSTVVWFIADGFIFFTFRCSWFVCFVDCVNFIFLNGMSDVFLHHIRFCFHVNNPFFGNFLCSNDQWIFEVHDLGARYSQPSLLQNQRNFTGKFQLVYILCPQQSTKRDKSSVSQIFSWSNYPLLETLGNPTKDNNRNFARGFLTDIYYYLISFTNWSKEPTFCKGFPHEAYFIHSVNSIIIVNF